MKETCYDASVRRFQAQGGGVFEADNADIRYVLLFFKTQLTSNGVLLKKF
jgi:hypothetical protein